MVLAFGLDGSSFLASTAVLHAGFLPPAGQATLGFLTVRGRGSRRTRGRKRRKASSAFTVCICLIGASLVA